MDFFCNGENCKDIANLLSIKGIANILSITGFVEVGGFRNLAYKYMNAIPNTTLADPNTTCGIPRSDALHIFRYL